MAALCATCAVAAASAQAAREVPSQAQFLAAATSGLAVAERDWWNPGLGWYDDRLDRSWRPRMPLAYLWSAFPLFETIDAIAIAEPSAATRAAVRRFAAGAERYWNPSVGGYAYYIGTHTRGWTTYFDDNGWWGIAFVDAFRATGDRRYLSDADRAFTFIVRSGWDSAGGGIWWDTRHDHTTAEPLAAAAYVGAVLYAATHRASYLAEAKKLVAWANAHSWNASVQLYGRNPHDGTPMDYVQGMMIGAELELCRAAGLTGDCAAAEALAKSSLRAFPHYLDWSATADGMYLRFLLDLYRYDGDKTLYTLAADNAARALANAATPDGLYMKNWAGGDVHPAGLLRTDAGTLALFAQLAATPPPS